MLTLRQIITPASIFNMDDESLHSKTKILHNLWQITCILLGLDEEGKVLDKLLNTDVGGTNYTYEQTRYMEAILRVSDGRMMDATETHRRLTILYSAQISILFNISMTKSRRNLNMFQ